MAMTRRPAAVEWRGEREEEPRRSRAQRRPEEARERVNRRWQEVLQETRVAQTGVQILFGFPLSLFVHRVLRGTGAGEDVAEGIGTDGGTR